MVPLLAVQYIWSGFKEKIKGRHVALELTRCLDSLGFQCEFLGSRLPPLQFMCLEKHQRMDQKLGSHTAETDCFRSPACSQPRPGS